MIVCLTGLHLKTVDSVQDCVLGAPVITPKVREVAALVASSAAYGAPSPFATFYLIDEHVRLVGGFGVSDTEGDEVTIVPAVAGG